MARHRNSAPSYVLHRQSGRGRLAWTDSLGIRHQKLLPGPFGSAESLAAKARLELELATSPTPAQVDPKTLTVAEVLIAYLDFAEQHYRDRPLPDPVRSAPIARMHPLALAALLSAELPQTRRSSG